MKTMNIAVIGCGRIGQMHIDNIQADLPQVHIKAAVDNQVDPQWLKDHGIEHLYTQQQLPEVFADPTIEAVVIATSSSAHVELIQAAAASGKHIFCEKPIGFTADIIQQAVDAVEKHNVIMQVGLNRRFDPDFQQVKHLVSQGAVGDVHLIRITNRDPKRPDLAFIPRSGGLFLDFNVHDFDMARFITGEEVSEVFAMGAVLVDERIAELNDIDTAIITLKMANGALCVIDTSREAVYGYDQRLEVFGSKGSVQAHNLKQTQIQLSTREGVMTEKPLYSFVERYREAYRLEMLAFFDALVNESPVLATIDDVQKAVGVAEAAQRSYETHSLITLNEGEQV